MSHDKTLLITGASSGIGEATARLAAKEGWRLALAARSMDKLEGLAEELGADRAKAFTVDVTDYESQEKMVQNTIDTFGSIDAVFANAGVGGSPGGFSGAPIESWQQIVNVNILGTAYTLGIAWRAQAIEGTCADHRIGSGTLDARRFDVFGIEMGRLGNRLRAPRGAAGNGRAGDDH